LYVGYEGNGVFNQSGGTAIARFFTTGYDHNGTNTGASGTSNLSGGIMIANGASYVGFIGEGVVNQSGGTHVTGELFIGDLGNGTGVASTGTYNQTGGRVTVSNTAHVGVAGNGNYNQSGGNFTAGSLIVGEVTSSPSPPGSGNYAMSNGAVIDIAGIETIGDQGRGVFTQTGGTHTIGASLIVGNGSGGIGLYVLAGGGGTNPAGTLLVRGDEIIGSVATGSGGSAGGSFNQSGGSHAIGAGTNLRSLYVGVATGSTGQYLLSDGLLTVTGDENFGSNGTGIYIQSGGTNQMNGTLYLGYNAKGAGNGTLTGGTLQAMTNEYVGSLGTGTFNQSGGSNSTTGLEVGAFGNGSYTLAGGVLTTGGTIVGESGAGNGSFVQSGGTHATGFLTLAFGTTGVGKYTMTGGTLTASNGANIGRQGSGTFELMGGTAQCFGTLFVNQSSIVRQSGGTLAASDVFNQGTIRQTGGESFFGFVSGPLGSLSVGNTSGAAAQMTLEEFDQHDVLVRSTGTMTISPFIQGPISTTPSLTIQGNGVLDLGHDRLLVDNVLTPEATVRQYLKNGYNAGPDGIGNWNGKGGMTSVDAIASHNGATPDFRVSVGYVNGASANDPLVGGAIPGQETLATNRILIRPTLYGDFNLDGKVDDTDLAIFSGLGQYNKANAKFGWLGGDLNHDGKVDDTDLLIFSGAGNYNGPPFDPLGGGLGASGAPTPSLTAHRAPLGDGSLDFVYNPATGDLSIHYDGDPTITAAHPLQVIRMKSVGGAFLAANFNTSAFGMGVTASAFTLNGTASGVNSIPDVYDLGAVLPTGLTVADLTSDLTLQWDVFGGGLTPMNGDVVVPEPAGAALAALVAAGLLARRHRRGRSEKVHRS
jgi:hypothetical protein